MAEWWRVGREYGVENEPASDRDLITVNVSQFVDDSVGAREAKLAGDAAATTPCFSGAGRRVGE